METLVPLRTNFNANGSVRWRTYLHLNLFHWPMGKNSGNGNGFVGTFELVLTVYLFVTEGQGHNSYSLYHFMTFNQWMIAFIRS